MKQSYALLLLLGAALTLTYCTNQTTSHPPPTSTVTSTSTPALTPTPDLGLHLLVEMKGNLSYKHPGWNDYQPLSFGTALRRGDLLKAAPNAEGLIVCADLRPTSVPSGYERGLPCPKAEPVLVRSESWMVEPRRGSVQATPIPYILSPRRTFIQTSHPLLHWHSCGTGIITYTVRMWGGALDWRAETTTTELRYPDDESPLESEVLYQLTVTCPGGHSSDEEKTALDLGFALLPSKEVTAVQSLIARVQELGLGERATRLLNAEIYADYKPHALRADAITLLEELADGEDAPAVHRRLGDLYLEVGLYTEAQRAYEHALEGYRVLGDRAGEAAALAGLGLAFRGNNEDATARERLKQAKTVYRTVGDVVGVASVKAILAEMEVTK